MKTEERGRRWMNAKKDWSGWQTDDKGFKIKVPSKWKLGPVIS